MVMVPSALHLGQKACLSVPHGFLRSVPKSVLPVMPAWKPGAVFLMVRLTMARGSLADLTLYDSPSAESSTAQSSAKKAVLSSLNSWLLSGVEHQRCGFVPSRLKILTLNWHVVRMPLSQFSLSANAVVQLREKTNSLTPRCYR